MSHRLDFEEPFEAHSELDEYEEEQLDGFSELGEEVGTFDTEVTEEWEEEARRGRRIPIRARRFPPRPVRPPRPPRPWPPKPPWPPRPSRPRPPVIVREPPAVICPPQGTEYVRWVQISLNRIMGLRLPVDGIMGPDTRSAIRSFQARQGLPVTGLVGPDTERALIVVGAGQASKSGEFEAFDLELADQEWEDEVSRRSPEYIRWLQQSLNKILGLCLTVDGMMGPQTRSAIRSFQNRQGLRVDGIVGPQTAAALIAAVGNPPPRTPAVPSPGAPAIPVRPMPGLGRTPPPPTEGPYAGITGTTCASGIGKCWRGPRSRDIVDNDVPWNDRSNRSATNYNAVLDYFNIGNSKGIDGSKGPENPRYVPTAGATYCNIYVHDVTRAMWASIPHWVRDLTQRKPPVGWRELNANRTYDWLRHNGQAAGWIIIDATLCQWLYEQFMQKISLPFSNPTVPLEIVAVGTQIASTLHGNPRLLAQESYVAQQFANYGLPTVIAWKNPKQGGHGHVAMVRPELSSVRGIIHRTGLFLPRSAQAGSKNWTNRPAAWIFGRPGVLFCVHA